MNRQSLTKTLCRLREILEKCGGPGGKPGPCASGGGAVGTQSGGKLAAATKFGKMAVSASKRLVNTKIGTSVEANKAAQAAASAAAKGKHRDAGRKHAEAADLHEYVAGIAGLENRKSENHGAAKLHARAAQEYLSIQGVE